MCQKRRSKSEEIPPPTRAEIGACYVYASEEHFGYKHCGLCRSLEHRSRDCEEREDEKGAMLAKMNIQANFEVGLSERISGLIWFGSVYLVTTAGFVADQLM